MFRRSRTRTLPTVLIAGSVAVSLAASLTACSDDSDTTGTNGASTATVRFINATNNAFDLTTGGVVGTGNGNLGFGRSTACMNVSTSNPNLGLNTAGTNSAVSGFNAGNLAAGGNYTIVALPGTGGTTQFVTIASANPNTLGSGQAGVRVFNATGGTGSYDVYFTAPGTTLGTSNTANATSIASGTASSWFNVGGGTSQVQFTNAGTHNVAFNWGNQTFTSGQNSIVVLGPAASGSTALRAFTIGGC